VADLILTGYRYVPIQVDDTLQDIAGRELGDANQWRVLIEINGLTFPYLSGDPTVIGPTVLAYGDKLIVPAPTVQVSASVDPNSVFGTDLELLNGDLQVVDGDFATVSGRANLKHALQDRIATPLADLVFHREYGCGIDTIRGIVSGPTEGVLAAQYVRGALLADPRVDSVQSATAVVAGDVTTITASAVPVDGTAIDLSVQV
jgi:phage baseplate assembly protein W